MPRTFSTRPRAVVSAAALAALLSITSRALSAQQRPDSTVRDTARRVEGVIVSAVRAGELAPISAKTVDRQTIERRLYGQDVPLLLQGSAPSLTAYAESGSPWGYSYMRLRGLDQSRINLTIDGIPLNDPEDQVLYFADFPDLGNSLQSAQVQRGVGTSSNGTASFAGSLNLETLPLFTSERGTEAQLQLGSFSSKRASVEYRTGLLESGFSLYARGSTLRTAGYRDHSGVIGHSGFLSAGYLAGKNVFKLIATAGWMSDTLAYLAVPEADLATNRRANPLTPGETDAFGERLAALSYTRLIDGRTSWSTSVYRIAATGDYDVAISPDLWNFNLDFAWHGVTSAMTMMRDALRADFGVNASTYERDHHAYVRPDLTSRLYFNTGHKQDASAFAKASYDLGRATLFGDLQLRHASFRYEPDVNAGIAERSVDWTFANPKVGATWRVRPSVTAYASFGASTREPARNDMFAGFDNLDTTNADFVGALTRVRPERVRDVEAGVTIRRSRLELQSNLFAMDFHNEIAPIGQLSYIGLPLRRNVPSSYRRGVELDATYRVGTWLVGGNATLLRARIREYVDSSASPVSTSRDVDPLLTPRVLSSQRVQWSPRSTWEIGAEGRYQGRSFLTNTGDASLVLPAFYVLDGSITYRYHAHSLTLRAQNLTDSKRYASGYAFGSTPAYYVLQPRSAFVTARIVF